MRNFVSFVLSLALVVPVGAQAQTAVPAAAGAPSASVQSPALVIPAPEKASTAKKGSSSPSANKDQPIEVSADKLDVYQDDHKAIFTGNVIAIQGTMNMRSAQMTVFYRQAADSKPKPGAPGAAPAPKAAKDPDAPPPGISRIEAQDHVVFTTPTEIATGDLGIYNADTDMIDLYGKIVTLTRDKNVLKGNHLNHNMDTGRSILTAGTGSTDVTGTTGTKPARVHGLFVPQSDNKPKPAAQPATSPAQPKASQ